MTFGFSKNIRIVVFLIIFEVVLLVLLISSVSIADMNKEDYCKNIIEFGKYLYNEEDYYRAITEFKRYIEICHDQEYVMLAEFKISMAYKCGGKYNQARKRMISLIERKENIDLEIEPLFHLAEIEYLDGKYNKSEELFYKYIEEYPKSNVVDEARFGIVWAKLKVGNDKEALKLAKSYESEILYMKKSDMEKLILGIEELDRINYKNPTLSGLLSVFIPGSGQIYCGRKKDGIIAFLMNGVFIAALAESFYRGQIFLGAGLTIFELSLYGGNIFSAVNCAYRKNYKSRIDLLNSLPGEPN